MMEKPSRMLNLLMEDAAKTFEGFNFSREELKEIALENLMQKENESMAEWEYIRCKEKYGNLHTREFLDIFNGITSDRRSLVPEDYPLSVKEFQIKFMYENYGWNERIY